MMIGGMSSRLAIMISSPRMVSLFFEEARCRTGLTVVVGTYNFGRGTYSDASGYNLDNQALVFKVKLPDHSRPYDRSPK